jgi:CheY-like chemotaxis protein
MPGPGGLGLLRRMRQDPALASTPVIVVSALCQMSYVRALEGLGVTEMLLKSRFSLTHLNDRIASLVGPAARRRYAVSA